MAITHLTPDPGDHLTLDETVELMRQTPHPVSKSTLTRWVTSGRLRAKGAGRGRGNGAVEVSYTDVLEVQREDYLRKRSRR